MLPPAEDGTNTVTHSQTMQRVRILECLALNRLTPSNLSHQSENTVENELERVSEPGRMKDSKETRPYSQNGYTFELTKTDAVYTGPAVLHLMGF